MNYKKSKDYDRLVELLDKGEHVVVLLDEDYPQFASFDKYKGYYIGDYWLKHDVEFSEFYSKSSIELILFCDRHNVTFFEPADRTDDLNMKMYALLQKMLAVFEAECHISCVRCHELRDEISELLACVQKNAENATQNSLCRTDETQRRSVWHPVTEVPMEKRQIVILRDASYDVRFQVVESCWSVYAPGWASSVKSFRVHNWAYFDELVSL